MSQKSYDRENVLYLVPTPIGNMKDISERVIETLKNSEIIFCEDTRIGGQLLHNLGISAKLHQCNEQNEDKAKEQILAYLNMGKAVSLMSDRGTPLISDPGYKVVEYITNHKHNVVALAGPTAFVPALISSGLPTQPFMFYGFLNSKQTKRQKELEFLKSFEHSIVFYEAPHRIIESLSDIQNIFQDRKASVSREITKMHEEIYRGKISEIKAELLEAEIRGEFVIVVDGNKSKSNFDKITIEEHVKMYMDEGLNEKESLKKVAKDRESRKSDIYKIYHKGR